MSTWSRVSSCLTQCLCLAEVTRYYLYCSQSASSPFQQVRPAQPSPHAAPSPLGGQLAPSCPQAPALTNRVAVAGCSLGSCAGDSALGQRARPSTTLDAGYHAEAVQ